MTAKTAERRHTHLHLNVKRTMPRHQIVATIRAAFELRPDTLGLCEMETPVHHAAFWQACRSAGYEGALPPLGTGGSALALAVRRDYGRFTFTKATFVVPGHKKVSPARYYHRGQVQRHADAVCVGVGEHHAYASGWTGAKHLDALRQLRWHVGMRVVERIVRSTTGRNELVIGGGDLNRPPKSFAPRPVLGRLLNPRGMVTAAYAATDGTFGRTVFDYVWVLSARVVAGFEDVSTPAFASDHDGVQATVVWSPPAVGAASRPARSAVRRFAGLGGSLR